MSLSAELQFEVPFHDTDMMGVAWHGHYFKYFELARTRLFRPFNCDVGYLRKVGIALPVIMTECRYVAPLLYGMTVTARATLVEMEFRLKVEYVLTEAATGKRLASGSTTQAAVRFEDGSLLVPLPLEIVSLFPASAEEAKR